ncbi:PBP1A family penicillin-binding protein [Acuticoccus sp. MNP-M23]|uniref:transglycosylase domain-containing protein n=1 Tax=Acuticoccus sp. MNP-M23 TaxID=3072793 RepID=UPI0028165AFA|nr:PBP1A family penicillin-binding protein [Acuticoccus sp. MNP-M23]WMS43716.1 PBP1A family penicillin-binding protein [Acuticoccus sp. MNP-M23]
MPADDKGRLGIRPGDRAKDARRDRTPPAETPQNAGRTQPPRQAADAPRAKKPAGRAADDGARTLREPAANEGTRKPAAATGEKASRKAAPRRAGAAGAKTVPLRPAANAPARPQAGSAQDAASGERPRKAAGGQPRAATGAPKKAASSRATNPRRSSADGAPVRAAPARPAAPAPRRKPRRKFSFVRFVFRMGVTLTLLGIVAVGGIIAYYAATMPPIAEWAVPERPPNVAILADDGALIANRGDTGGRAVTLESLPAHVPQAVIAIEDRRFYAHPGVDPIGLARAMATNLSSGQLRQGGSTLSQQLAKNLFLSPSRTIERKIQEMILAVWLEIQYSKDEILSMYLNRVYLGAGAYGVDGAARQYFDKPAEDLTIAEAAMVAGLLKAPSYYAPTNNIGRAQARAAIVVEAMREQGYITDMDALVARENPATVRAPKVATSGGYVADWVADVLPGFVGSITEDVIVETSVDLELQDLAQAALQDTLDTEGAAKGVSQGAVVVLDSGGAVKALVGGRKYGDSQYNRAVDAARQPGSAFKPFVYLAALEDGLSPQTMRIDQPLQIGNWKPQNYNKKYRGPVSLQTGLSLSLNTIAVQLAMEVGPQAVVDTAHRLGVRSNLQPNASIALGTSEVTLLELTTAYVPFSNGGVGVVPYVIRRIKTAEGNLLYERSNGGSREVLTLEHAGQMNQMMAATVTSGTARRAELPGWQAAGKTGTSQDWRDAWFVGYTAFFTAGVWLGNDDNSPTKRATGGTLPAVLWKQLMENVHEGMRPAELPGAPEAAAATLAMDVIPADDPWNAPAVSTAPPGADAGVARGARGWAGEPENAGGSFLRRLFGG